MPSLKVTLLTGRTLRQGQGKEYGKLSERYRKSVATCEIDPEDLKKLSPEERLKKLKELEENSKREIEEARKLMAESQRELEIKEEHERDMPIPQLTSIDIDSLFGQEEKELFMRRLKDNTVGNRYAVDYPPMCPGLSHGMAWTTGRLAGLSAAAERGL